MRMRPWLACSRFALWVLGPWLVIAALALSVAGCGGSKPHHAPPPQPTIKVCSGLTDKCATAPRSTLTAPQLHPSHGCKIVDVSDYQGFIRWSNTTKTICGAVNKAGEGSSYVGGRYFAHNWAAQRALHLWHSAYWFVRPVGCEVQARLFIARLKSVHYGSDPYAGPPQLDEEAHANYAGCFKRRIRAALHVEPGVYTGPGTWPGGSHAGLTLWQAEYGPTLHVFWRPVVAWQCTDGIYGCRTFVPGIGWDDVSVNLGMTNLHGPGHNRPCFGRGHSGSPRCRAVQARVTTLRARLKHRAQQVATLKGKIAKLRKAVDR